VLDALVAPWTGVAGQPAFYRQIAQADQCYTDEVQDRYGDIGIPDSRLHLLPGAGHLVQIDAPERVLDVVREFLRG
jgi:pimeloyl-ACP methyl ester carboxylesterase